MSLPTKTFATMAASVTGALNRIVRLEIKSSSAALPRTMHSRAASDRPVGYQIPPEFRDLYGFEDLLQSVKTGAHGIGTDLYFTRRRPMWQLHDRRPPERH